MVDGRRIGWFSALALLALGACGEEKKKRRRSEDPDPAPAASATASGSGSPSILGSFVGSRPASGSDAYIAIEEKGILRVSADGTLSRVKGVDGSLLVTLAVGGDGKVYASLGNKGVFRLEGDEATLVPGTAGHERFKHVAATKTGKLWLASYKGLSFAEGGSWQLVLVPNAKLDPFPGGLALDDKDQAWAPAKEGLVVASNDVGTVVPTPTSRDHEFNILAGGAGSVFASNRKVLLECKSDKTLTEIPLPDRTLSIWRLGASQNGTLGAAISHKGGGHSVPIRSRSSWASGLELDQHDHVKELAVDDRGRAWAVVGSGLKIGGTGDRAVEWSMGTFREIDAPVRSVAVLGSGPGRLPEARPVIAGFVKGRLTKDGKDVGGAKIFVCQKGELSCSERKAKLVVTAGADGSFELRKVPIGLYRVSAEQDGQRLRSSETFEVTEKDTVDWGSIALKSSLP